MSKTIETPPQAMTVKQALASAQAMGIEPLDAQLLLLFALGRTSRERAWLLAHDEDTILPDEESQFLALMQRRAIGVPIAYLTGEKEFYGLSFSVDKRVLVPRPETELLVEWALELIDQKPANTLQNLLDLGTGSGIIAVTLKRQRPDLEVTATDYSHEALAVAQLNASDLLQLGQSIRFLQGAWCAPLANEQFDFIVSNPPYIAQGDNHLEALTHEPQQALVAGDDGLDDIRQIIEQSKKHLRRGGHLLLEHGYDQAQITQQLMASAGLTMVESRNDLAGIARVTKGTNPL